MAERDFEPYWASAPGETIVDILEEKFLSRTEFGNQLGYAANEVEALLSGQVMITIDLARKLAAILGSSTTFWMIREAQYREDVARLARLAGRTNGREWLSELPVKDMLDFGWIAPSSSSVEAKEEACLHFFGMADAAQWRQAYRAILERTTFRTSPTFDSEFGAVAAWLRQGELESMRIECEDWDPRRFQETLMKIRELTRKKNPEIFIPELRALCAECGVAMVILRAPKGCRASGVTRFLSSSKALLMLSFRYLSDDHFWFTFFHEAAHLILHGKRALFLEGPDMAQTREEREANEFSSRILVPSQFRAELLELPRDSMKVIRFARKIGISPGIVVGQLQHLGKLQPNQLNKLKRRFAWA